MRDGRSAVDAADQELRRQLAALAAPVPVRRAPGELTHRAFLAGMLDRARDLLPDDLRNFESRAQSSLVKAFYDDPAIHYEAWLHRRTARVEVGLHFETRDSARNARLLDACAEDLPFLKLALSDRLEAERWDRGWTRLYLTVPFEPLLPPFQAALADQYARTIELLEPLRREAVRLHP